MHKAVLKLRLLLALVATFVPLTSAFSWASGDCRFTITDYWADVFHFPYWDIIAEQNPQIASFRNAVTRKFQVWHPSIERFRVGFVSDIQIQDHKVSLFIPVLDSRSQNMELTIESGEYAAVFDPDGGTHGLNAPFLAFQSSFTEIAKEVGWAENKEIVPHFSMKRVQKTQAFKLYAKIEVPVDYAHLHLLMSFVEQYNRWIPVQK